ncbi:response regulator [Paenibacillus sp. YIM B09110]|uniref:response regulator n=1 Tax=Paenibacillus sp. YIM B09110 TaxID=3126102 RepID=UPI00301CD6B7
MFRVIIVEDEKPILNLMKVIIGQNPHYTILNAFSNPLEALERMAELKPDIAFLDVEMPKMSGIALAEKIGELSEYTKIVFTTAYKQYALDAFQVYAFDYILKPVTPDAIERIANRLLKLQLSSPLVSAYLPAYSPISCFGGFDVRNGTGTQSVRFPTRKSEELLAYFLCHPRRDISKWRIIDLLWPELPEERALHNLHNTIYRLKKLTKEHGLSLDIQKTNDGYLLEPLQTVYDALEYEQLETVLTEEFADIPQAERLSSLYKGPLLAGKDYLWKASLEENYARKYNWLIRNLVLHDFAMENWSKSESRLQDYLSIYPLQEEMNRLLLKLYNSIGDVHKAAAHSARFEELCLNEFGVDPLSV